MKPRFFAIAAMLAPVFALRAELLSIRGSSVVGAPVGLAAEGMKEKHGIEYRIIVEGGSPAAIAGLGLEVVDVALSTRPATGEELAAFPGKRFTETKIGAQALLVIVPDQVWQGGVEKLTRRQLMEIYEGRVKNWKELGGHDRKIEFYNRPSGATGRGTWDLFAIWLYGDVRKAPLSKAEVLQSADEVRDTVEFNSGAISFMEFADMPKSGVRALTLVDDAGDRFDPSLENIAKGKYPLSRPLYVITRGGKPVGAVKDFLDYMTGPAGQACVEKAGHVTLAKLAEGER